MTVPWTRHLLLGTVLALVLAGVSCRTGPPKESGTFKKTELVEIVSIEPGIRLDIRYATTNNFMGRTMYPQARAFLQRPAALALTKAHHALARHGYGILVFDGYRPWSVTKAFWDAATPAQRRIEFVANPRKGSRHNRGCAVDVTLFHLDSGRPVEMPSDFDEFTERASPAYTGGTPQQRAARDLLRQTMEQHGFTVYKEEWWHFDYENWKSYRILNIPFQEIH